MTPLPDPPPSAEASPEEFPPSLSPPASPQRRAAAPYGAGIGQPRNGAGSDRTIDVTRLHPGLSLALTRGQAPLVTLGDNLADAPTVEDVVQVVDQFAARILGTSQCRVLLWQEDRRRLVVCGGQPATAAEPATLDRDDSGPLALAFRSGNVMITGDRATVPIPAFQARTASVLGKHPTPGTPTAPRVMGVIDLAWPRSAPTDLLLALRGMAETIGKALGRAVLHDAHRGLVQGLQREVLRTTTPVPGLQIAAAYRVGGVQVGLGGDWHEVIRLGPTRTAFVIGDVVGHGGAAVGRMTVVRGVIGALLLTDPDPATLWQRAAKVLSALDDPFVGTAAVCVVDVEQQTLTYVRAGHLPLCLRSGDGTVSLLIGGHAPALGLPSGRTVPGSVAFATGTLVLAFTDGLVERRDEDLDVGLQRLADEMSGWGRDCPLDIAVALAVQHAATFDDVAALAVRRE